MAHEVWAVGEAYESYVGRWSRHVAAAFLRWLDVGPHRVWLDAGCGTGALTAAILAEAEPASVLGVDPSEGFLATARMLVSDPRASFHVGDAHDLPAPDGGFDAVVSGLMLNFVPGLSQAVAEFVRAAKSEGGVVAAYVWDYAEGMEMMRHFWEAAITVDPAAVDLDEGLRFPICKPEALWDEWRRAGLGDVLVRGIEVPTVFADFDDFWTPFLGGQGAAPAYAMSLAEDRRDALRDVLRNRLPRGADGSISLHARAWAVKGRLGTSA